MTDSDKEPRLDDKRAAAVFVYTWTEAIRLQSRRLFPRGPEFSREELPEELPPPVYADAHFLVIAVKHLHRAVALAKGWGLGKELKKELAVFEAAFGGAGKVRDYLEHFDEEARSLPDERGSNLPMLGSNLSFAEETVRKRIELVVGEHRLDLWELALAAERLGERALQIIRSTLGGSDVGPMLLSEPGNPLRP